MENTNNHISEADRRRKRINLYKRIIVITIIVLILLPSLLCIILFCKVNNLNKEIKELRAESVLSAQAGTDADKPVKEPSTQESGTEEATSPSVHANVIVEPAASEDTPEETTPEETTQTVVTQQEQVAKALAEGRKVVYLTFDDGPCDNTSNLLDVLDEYNVKVTFFVNGYNAAPYSDELNRIVSDGHSLAMHTYSHNYSAVYASLDSFKNEVVSLQDYLYNVTGVSTRIFRFPGGSSNSQTKVPINTFIDYLNQQNIVFFDWNVSSGDGGSRLLTPDEVYTNVINGVEGKDVSVVLMHDSVDKLTTYQAIPKIIEKLQAMDALILPITTDTEPVHHNIN